MKIMLLCGGDINSQIVSPNTAIKQAEVKLSKENENQNQKLPEG